MNYSQKSVRESEFLAISVDALQISWLLADRMNSST